MGRLVPEDFLLSSLANDSELRVVEAFRDGLTDGWVVVPDVGLRSDRDYQMDLVLVHPDWGVVVIEVKGHRVEMREGVWHDSHGPLRPQPMVQARSNAYTLRNRLRTVGGDDLIHLNVEYGVAIPNSTEVVGTLPTDTTREQVLTGTDLEDPQHAVESLMSTNWANQRLSAASVETIVRTLRPDVEFSWAPDALATASRVRLDQLCADQVAALESLDANRRVFVAGRAGTGKTRLAVGWARRAYAREERVLLTCYNDPLADQIAERLPGDDTLLIGAFLRVAFDLGGMPPLAVPGDADHEWWNTQALEHLHRHWHEVTDRFDTIVVDEGQDFSPAWLALLDTLLDPDGPRRMLVVADGAQILYDRGFRPPRPDEGWTVAELVNNCRNAHPIARLLRRRLDGARSPVMGPEGFGVRWEPAEELGALVVAVGVQLDRLLRHDERDPSGIIVATLSSAVRETLRSELGLVRWEDRGDAVACENVHRIKGLEADTVLLVSGGLDVTDALLYVGISRAVSELVVIGPASLADRLGLT